MSSELYKKAQETLVSSLLADGTDAIKVMEIVSSNNFEEPDLLLIFEAMAELLRNNEVISADTVASELEQTGNLKKVGGIATLYNLRNEGFKHILEAPVTIYAKIVKRASAQNNVRLILEESKDLVKEDSGVAVSDAVSEILSSLNNELNELSTNETTVDFSKSYKDYLSLLEKRREVSEFNQASGHKLQGIPTSLKTLSELTTGWSEGQLITVGARTGIGKALCIDTPILTSDGWKTMGTVSKGDKVYNRFNNLIEITNVSEVMYDHKVVELYFSTGETIIADLDHLWDVYDTVTKSSKTITTAEIIDNVSRYVILTSDDIISINKYADHASVPVRCITVDSHDRVFLVGKTFIPTHNSIFAVNNAVAAAGSGKTVLFFSLEMSTEELQDRIMASIAGVSLNDLKQGIFTDVQREKIREASKMVNDMNIIIETDPKLTIDSIRAKAIKQSQTPVGLDLIIIDYLQLITPSGRFGSRQEAVADISRNMKLLSKQLNVPVMVVVQLKREEKDSENPIPRIDDIRESGAIAQDSDVVILLHRDQTQDDTTPPTLVILAKQRQGPANKIIRCHSNLAFANFTEMKKTSDIKKMSEDEHLEYSDDIDFNDFEDIDLEF